MSREGEKLNQNLIFFGFFRKMNFERKTILLWKTTVLERKFGKNAELQISARKFAWQTADFM